MVRYHDLGEIETGDIIEVVKTEEDGLNERDVVNGILERFPRELGDEIKEILIEKEEHESIEARIVHVIDKIEAQILIATENGVEEVKNMHRSLGINLADYATRKISKLRDILIEWELDVLVELLDEVWERQKELGILEEDPQLRLELEEAKEKESGKED